MDLDTTHKAIPQIAQGPTRFYVVSPGCEGFDVTSVVQLHAGDVVPGQDRYDQVLRRQI